MRAFSVATAVVCLGVVVCLPIGGAVSAGEPSPTDAQVDQWLAELVDLDKPAARMARAGALAAREDVSLERWLAACARFGTFVPAKPGMAREDVPLPGASKVSITTLVPPGYDPKTPTPLLMSFHGSGGDGRWAAAHCRALAEKHGCVVVAPHEPLAAQGYTASAQERDAAWAAVRWARRRFNIDERRMYAVGFSRGAHLVWDMALRQPDRFAGIAPVVGAPRLNLGSDQNNLRYVENLVSTAVWSVQGAGDDARMLHNVRMTFDRLRKFKAVNAKLFVQADRGHDADWTAVDWSDWIATTRDPVPARVIRRAVQNGAARAAWIEALEISDKATAQFVLRVPASRVANASDTKIREIVQKEADKRTARLEAKRLGPGKFSIKATHVTRARLLLDQASLGDGKVVHIQWRGRAVRKPIERTARVLLIEFAERFDRTFLPVAEVSLP